MISEEKLKLFFNSIIQTLTDKEKPSSKIRFQDDDHDNEDDFIREHSGYITTAKKQIAQIINKNKDNLSILKFNEQEIKILAQLKSCLKMINSETKFLLEEGILILVLNLEDIRKKIAEQSFLQNLVHQITLALSTLLKKYFVYQEYKKKKQRKTLVISAFKQLAEKVNQKQNENPHKQSKIDLNLLREIQNQMNSNTVQDLIDNYLENQIVSIKEKQETCRICSKKIKLEFIQRHVKLCSRTFNLKQKLIQNKLKYQSLKAQVSKMLKELNLQEVKTQENESLKKIITAFLKEQMIKKEKVRNRRRSGTMLQANTDKSLKIRWEFLLFDHQSIYSENETLSELLSLEKQRTAIQKNLADVNSMIASSENSNGAQSTNKISNLDNMFQKSIKSMKFTDRAKSKNEGSQENPLQKLNKEDYIISDNQSFLEIKKPRTKRFSQQIVMTDSFVEKLRPFQTGKSLFKKVAEEQSKESFGNSSQTKNYVSLQHITLEEEENDQISIESFQYLKVLGKGAFGKVYLVRRKETEDLYALKIIAISQSCSQKDLENIKTEHQIFKKIKGDHLVKAPFSFSQKGCHIFVMQLMPGGDLRKVLTQQTYFQESVAKFYLAEIILAIQHLHQYDIIHRDLKPENIVLDQEGHIKLTDFGLSAITLEKRLQKSREMENKNSKKKSRRRVGVSFKNIQGANLIGTPDYIAPEIINHISTENQTIDWWSLGVMAYQLLIGTRPFSGDTIEEVIENIHNFNIDWPQVGSEDGISAQAKDFIQKLLNKNFASRLGSQGVQEIKQHPFFNEINWQNIKYEKAPLQPNITEIYSKIKDSQDQLLRKQVQERVGSQKNHSKKLKLQKFVRYDLLGTQTIENVEKIVSEKKDRLKKLRTCKTFDVDHSGAEFKSPSINEVTFN